MLVLAVRRRYYGVGSDQVPIRPTVHPQDNRWSDARTIADSNADVLSGKTGRVSFVSHKSQTHCPARELGPVALESGEAPCELWLGNRARL